MSGAAAVRSLRPLSAVVVPGWLAEIVRPRRAPVPWPEMARAALAICVPLSVSFAAGRGSLGVLPATGGLLGTLADAGGPYLSRVKRVCSAAVFGGAAGLAIGAVTHGHGWLAVVALAAGRGPADRHADRLCDRAADRVRAVADELVLAPAAAVRAGRARRVPVPGRGAGYWRGPAGAGAPRAGAGAGPGAGPPARSRMRRSTYRALADLRAEFQRTMSEPPSISRRATAWWPAVVALEQVMDAGTATALAVSRGAQVSPSGVRQLSDALRAVSEAAATGSALAEAPELPDDETLKPVTDAVRALLGVLGTGERLTVLGRAGRFWSGWPWSGWPDSNRRPPRPKIVMSVHLGC